MVWSGSTLYPFSVWSESTLFATLSSLIRICTICHSSLAVNYKDLNCLPLSAVWSGSILFPWNLTSVYTVCHLQQLDQGLHYLPFSDWSGSTLFAFCGSRIGVYTISILTSSLIRVYIVSISQRTDQGLHYFHSQSDQGLHYLPLSAVWSGSALFAILP